MAIPMTETEIPDDVRETAEKMMHFVADAMIGEGMAPDHLANHIALALLSERQAATARERARCAAIADTTGNNPPDLWAGHERDREALDWGWMKGSQSIAHAIRTETGND